MTLYRGALRLLHRTPKGVYHKDLSACNAYENGESASASITAPSQLTGEEDKMTAPRASQKVVDRLNDAEVVRLPKAGHSMLSEAPNQVLNALSSFLPLSYERALSKGWWSRVEVLSNRYVDSLCA